MRAAGLILILMVAVLAGALVLTQTPAPARAALLAHLALPFQATGITFEADTNRAGSDYRDFDIQADPNACRAECWKDATCKSFTYVKPGTQGQYAHCWLKSAVPNGSANTCCVSGYKTGGDSNPSLEVDVNRRGGDYQDFELRSNNPYDCRTACANDGRCASFTYVRPSFFGPNSHCFLKGSVPNATQEGCCISGVVRAGGGGGGTAITWDNSSAKDHRGHNGEHYSYSCPGGGTPATVWGTDTYTDDSSICTAAVHAGIINLQSGGTVTIEIRGGQQGFQGSTRYGITTRDYGGWPGSYIFVR
ncbi:MAG TPA: PAN domain-containing protein [Pyrinomonadaceae bacterium]|nr:PAN domain-containing protein [Pyrinomonadaceae bacterium]